MFALQTQLILALSIKQSWYALPLIVAISLVYAATRHELMKPILVQAARTAMLIGGLMGVIVGVLYWMSKQV